MREEHKPVRTFDLGEAADFLKINYSTASRMASSGVLPGAKIGSSWVFLEEALTEWLREQTIKQRRERLALTNVEDQLENPSQKPKKKSTRRRKPVPLPELPGEVGSPEVGVSS